MSLALGFEFNLLIQKYIKSASVLVVFNLRLDISFDLLELVRLELTFTRP